MTHPRSELVFDPAEPVVDESAFRDDVDWEPFCGDIEEEMPPFVPKPRGDPVSVCCFVDANHAGNVVTRRSHTGVLIFINKALAPWFSEKQNTVESSTFGSEFVALRIAAEQIKALRHKLRMFGVPLTGPASVFCDNQGVVKNVSIPESTLHKKHNAVNCHVVGEATAMGILRVGKEGAAADLADGFTKVQPAPRRKELFSCVTR
jgi:hypothetical protein